MNGERIGRPFDHEWTFWYENKSNTERRPSTLNPNDYLDHINQEGTFQTVQGFYDSWNDLQNSRDSSGDCNYLLFKTGITPVWEDRQNSRGGKCFVVVPKTSRHETNRKWVTLLLTVLIGEFDAEINGAVLSNRSWGNMFAVWTRGSEKQTVDSVSNKLYELFGDDVQVKFQKHQTVMRKKFNRPGGRTSPEHRSDEEEHDNRAPEYIPRRRSVGHDTGASPTDVAHAEPAKEVPAMPSDTQHPGTAGEAAVFHPFANRKPRRNTVPPKSNHHRQELDLQKGFSTAQMTGIVVLLLAGLVATSTLCWRYI